MLGKRDYLQLILAFFIFTQYKYYISGSSKGRVVLLWSFSAIILLIHEGLFFAVFPFMILHTYMSFRSSWKKALMKVIMLWWPMGFVLCLVMIYHGNAHTAQVVWWSWQPCFDSYPLIPDADSMENELFWMDWSLAEGIRNSLDCSWHLHFFGLLPVWPFNLYMFFCIYFLLTRMNTIRMGWYAIKSIDHVQLSNTVILQFLFISPLMGIIACDMCRFVPYWCITSCILYGLFPDRNNIPVFIDRFSMFIQKYIDDSRLLKNSWLYFIVLITLPLCFSSASPNGMFPFLPNDMKYRLMEMLVG